MAVMLSTAILNQKGHLGRGWVRWEGGLSFMLVRKETCK